MPSMTLEYHAAVCVLLMAIPVVSKKRPFGDHEKHDFHAIEAELVD